MSADLAQRLVEAATHEIVNAPHDDHDVPDYEVAGRAAAVAVLRELALAGLLIAHDVSDFPKACRALADSIEKGETA
jgi:hypothetical protein